eukprot:8593841-Pyramimonas_sp.AAC.1
MVGAVGGPGVRRVEVAGLVGGREALAHVAQGLELAGEAGPCIGNALLSPSLDVERVRLPYRRPAPIAKELSSPPLVMG